MKKLFTLIAAAVVGINADSTAQTYFKENFEGVTTPALPAGFTQATKAATGWKTNKGTLNATNGWKVLDHTQYAVVDEWNNNEDNDSTVLITPKIDLSAVTTPTYLKYDCYFVKASYTGGTPTETAYVRISTDGGNTWTNIDTVAGVATAWQHRFKNITAYTGAGMNNLKLGFYYSDGAGGASKPLIVFAVDNILVYTPANADGELADITPKANTPKSYAAKSSQITLGGELVNLGSNPITSFNVKYQVGSGTPTTSAITGVNIASQSSYVFTCSVPLALPSTTGDNPINMWIEVPADVNNTNDSATTAITTVTEMPVKKLLLEEGTGTWCGWCPRGAVYMDSLWHTVPNDVSLVAVHNGDPMTLTAYDNFVSGKIGGYPSVLVDRREEVDPSDLIDVHAEQKDYFGFAQITLADQNASNFDFSVKVTVKPAIDLNGDYRLALALTEDNVTGTGSTWGQRNYYSNNAPLTGAGHDWFSEPGTVPDSKMTYQFVARAIVPSPAGAAGSLPSSMTAGNTYDYTFNTTISNAFHRYNNNMRAVVMLIRNSDGAVLNSNYMTVPVGIVDVKSGVEQLLVYPNPATDKSNVKLTLTEGNNVTIQVIDAMGKMVAEVVNAKLDKGTHNFTINTANMAAGVYNVKIQTEKGAVTERLSVVK